MIDHTTIKAELTEVLHREITKSLWSKLTSSNKVPVKKTVTRKDGTTFTETFYTAVKQLFSKPEKTAELYPGSFANVDEAEKVLGKPNFPGPLDDWNDQIAPKHKHAIKQYTGFWSSKINGIERGSIFKTDLNPQEYNQARQYSSLIEEALDKYELKQDIVVHRQVSKSLLSELQASKGSLFIDSGFLSTTVVKDSVDRQDSIDMVIKVPKGKGRGAYIKHLSEHPFENEFLINSHSVYTVDNVKKVNGRWQVELTWSSRLEVS